MPNLAGVFDLREEPADLDALVEKMSRVLRVEGVEYHERSWHDARFGAVNLLSGILDNLDQPAVSDDGELVLFLDGEVYNRAELRAQLGAAAGGRADSAAGLCLALYQAHGEAFAGLLNGQFNVVVYDRRARTVKVFNDRLGYRPFYYLASGGLFLFALEQKAILAASEAAAEIDRLAVLQLFAFGHHLEDRTFFRGIQALPQGAVLTVGPEGVRVRQYWKPAYRRPVRMGLGECAEEMGRRLLKAVARQASDGRRKVLFLSGGLDSRGVAAALARITSDVTAFTMGDDELWHAREVARRLGFRHRQLVYPDNCYHGALPRVVWRTECTIPFHGCTSVEQHKYLRAEGGLLFNGHLGDALFGDHLLPQHFLMSRREQLVASLLARRTYMHPGQLPTLFRKDFLQAAYPELEAAVRRTVAGIEEDRIPLVYNVWDLTQRQRRYTFSSPAIDRYFLEPVTPFTDIDVVEWGLSMPLRFLVGRRAYTRMLHDLFPDVAAVPVYGTGLPVPAGSLLDLARRGGVYVSKRLRRLWGGRGPNRGSNTSSDLMDPRLEERLHRYLASDAFLSDVFDPGLVRGLLDRHFRRGEPHVYAVATLLTVAEGTRLFVERDVDSPPEEVQPELSMAGAV